MHIFAYNAVDAETGYSPPAVAGGGATQYAYNLDKQLTAIARPDGQVVSLRYDTAGRLVSMSAPGVATAYGYSATTGKLADVTSANGEILSYTYDGFLPLSENWSGPVAGSVSFTYNNDFNLVSTSINGAGTITRAYDADGLPVAVGALSIGRSPQTGYITQASVGGVATNYTYNQFGELASERSTASGAVLFDVQYTRDKLGRITQKVETAGGATKTFGYVYDAGGRLVQATLNGVVTAVYAYDANGNRLGRADAKGITAGVYDAQDRLLSYGSNNYIYTANGELLTKTNASGTAKYQYDALGNFLSVALPDGTLVEYIVDGANRRVGKKINGVLVQGWLYSSQLTPIAELDGNGNVVSVFVYGTKANVPDYVVKNGTTYRILSDHLGSPRVAVDSVTGAIAEQITYDEFGNVLSDSNPDFIPFGFAGGLYDKDTGLVRFGARDYDAETARWTRKDPIKFYGGDSNLYGYVLNDPLN